MKFNILADSIPSFGSSLSNWLHQNYTSPAITSPHSLPWSNLFPIGLYSLWLDRNNRVFHSDRPSKHSEQLTRECMQRALEFFFIVGSGYRVGVLQQILIKWKPPSDGWVQLNTDGSLLGNPG